MSQTGVTGSQAALTMDTGPVQPKETGRARVETAQNDGSNPRSHDQWFGVFDSGCLILIPKDPCLGI